MTIGELRAKLAEVPPSHDQSSVRVNLLQHELRGHPKYRESLSFPVEVTMLISHGLNGDGVPMCSFDLCCTQEVEQSEPASA